MKPTNNELIREFQENIQHLYDHDIMRMLPGQELIDRVKMFQESIEVAEKMIAKFDFRGISPRHPNLLETKFKPDELELFYFTLDTYRELNEMFLLEIKRRTKEN